MSSFDPHPDVVKSFAGCDEQAPEVFAAKAYVRRPGFIDSNMTYLIPGLIEYGDSLSCQVNIAPVIDSHSVRT